MSEAVRRILTKSGAAYAVDQPWPGTASADGPINDDALIVGAIFFLPGEEVPVSDEKDEIVATETTPPRYEVWGATKRAMAAFRAVWKGEADSVPKSEWDRIEATLPYVHYTVVYADSVESHDDWRGPDETMMELHVRIVQGAAAVKDRREAFKAKLDELFAEAQEKSNGAQAHAG